MKQINLALIGLGVIATHYGSLLDHEISEKIRLIRTVDKNPGAAAAELFSGIPFSSDLNGLYDEKPDLALVSASASAHYGIIEELLTHGIGVISEKPLCGSFCEAKKLYALAEKNGAALISMYHWQYTDETLWFKNKEDKALFGALKSIRLDIHDNYACGDGENIRKDRAGMMGCIMDELPNALSFIDAAALPLRGEGALQSLSVNKLAAKNGGYLYADIHFEQSGVPVEITIDWRKDSFEKIFYIEYENALVTVLHSEKRLLINGKEAFEWKAGEESLDRQYRRFFTALPGIKDKYENRSLTEYFLKMADLCHCE